MASCDIRSLSRHTQAALAGALFSSALWMGSVVWVSEGQMPLFFDPALKGQAPALPFRIYAVPLRKEDIR